MTHTKPRPAHNPFEVPSVTQPTQPQTKKTNTSNGKRPPADLFVTIWKDPESSRGGLLTYVDAKTVAQRTEDEVTRATNPTPKVLQDTSADRTFLDEWLAAAHPRDTHLAIPLTLAVDILGWEL